MPEQISFRLFVFRIWMLCGALVAVFMLAGCATQSMKTSEAISPEPVDVASLNNQALKFMQQHRYGEAAMLLETGLESAPDVADLHYNLAVISELYLLDLDRALIHYQRYQTLSANEDKKVTGWITDLKRRLE
ncbi:hypothetical protein [Marinobacter sp. 2_MG-2023]|uniref:hypothetical protein n=1 Tax=Marinobacter sp. 2_MG-2023 TaxID=3062679 RepID=UPI0026E1A742|nr:hypothetical protein [Marinobacter sp. 2_MG-2023]MDO6442487.1 hypothetical protein [Marinobacter sp. 2_MG-2023]